MQQECVPGAIMRSQRVMEGPVMAMSFANQAVRTVRVR
jgi:hypothetical protein